jgi:hypothetical protein
MLKFIKLLILLCSTNALHNKSILQFSSGNYVLSPEVYGYQKQIIVEMWGAGGAGNLCNGYGGTSGGYVKAIINTKLREFNLTVGRGGTGNFFNGACATGHYNDLPQCGEDTTFTSCDDSLNLISSGGKWNKSIPIVSNNTLMFTDHVDVLYNIAGLDGKLVGVTSMPDCTNGYPSSSLTYTYSCYAGGNSPFGGQGGTQCFYYCQSSYGPAQCQWINKPTDGMCPGGGGGGNGFSEIKGIMFCASSLYPSKGTNGCDGMINIYI